MARSVMKNTLLTYFKGVAMGGADVVPGVSGGTVAFITGIYEELLDAIKAVDPEALKLLFKFKLADFWQKVNGPFLLPLVAGIITSLFTLAHLLKHLLEHYPIQLWSFFFGLIIISSVLVLKEVGKWRLSVFITISVGIAIAYYITIATPATTPEALWFIFLAGCIAICAMILPGISGAFILLIFGKYEFILGAVSKGDIGVIIVFALGCITGLLTFARAVSYLLKKYHDIAIALLAGFMIGSLNKVWPWKIPIAFRLDSEGNQLAYHFKSVFPGEYLERINEDPKVFQAILFIALGIFIVVAIERIAHYRRPISQ